MQEKDLLQKAMQQKNMMVLYRDELVAPEYAGVPVAVENELVVLQRQTNFVLDGYCALRTGDITEAEQMDDVPFLKKVMAGEKLYDAVKAPGFACRGWRQPCPQRQPGLTGSSGRGTLRGSMPCSRKILRCISVLQPTQTQLPRMRLCAVSLAAGAPSAASPRRGCWPGRRAALRWPARMPPPVPPCWTRAGGTRGP